MSLLPWGPGLTALAELLAVLVLPTVQDNRGLCTGRLFWFSSESPYPGPVGASRTH